MYRHHRSLLFLLMLGYHASTLASPVHHVKHTPVVNHHRKTKTSHSTLKSTRQHKLSPNTVFINTLMAQLGKPYRWGGASPETGFDCSGLIWYAWRKNFHITLPRTAAGMYSMPQAHHVPYMLLQPGDMVFFSMHGERVDHVGVYVGNGHFIEAPHTGQNVKIVSLEKDFYRRHYLGARRLMIS